MTEWVSFCATATDLQAEDDEPDPLDAFMAGNAAALEVQATQEAAEDAAAASQPPAAGSPQQQQQEEEEVDPLDAFMQEAVLPEVAKPSAEPLTASAGAGAASTKSTGSADGASTAAADSGKPPTAVAPARFISSRSMLFVRPAGAAAAAARPGAAGRAAKAKRLRNLYSSSDDSSDGGSDEVSLQMSVGPPVPTEYTCLSSKHTHVLCHPLQLFSTWQPDCASNCRASQACTHGTHASILAYMQGSHPISCTGLIPAPPLVHPLHPTCRVLTPHLMTRSGRATWRQGRAARWTS
jgi:hypothetical protein